MKHLCALIFATILAVACSKESGLPTETMSNITFKEWMGAHAPEAIPLADNPLTFVHYVEHGQQQNDELTIAPDKWVYLNYTIYTLSGDIIVTRQSEVGRRLGTWLNSTHWSNDFVQFYDNNKPYRADLLTNGLRDAIMTGNNGGKMNAGDSARIYIAASQGYVAEGVGGNMAYLNPGVIYSGFPVYIDMRMVKVVPDPAKDELEIVNRYAKEKWGQTLNDTIKTGLYIRKIVNNPKGYSITKDSSVKVVYAQYFMDKFLVTTNSDSIAKALDRYDTSNGTDKYNTLSMTPDPETASEALVLSYVLQQMRKGETVEVITTSTWSEQGNMGDVSGTPEVLPYQPTIYTIQALEDKKQTASSVAPKGALIRRTTGLR